MQPSLLVRAVHVVLIIASFGFSMQLIIQSITASPPTNILSLVVTTFADSFSCGYISCVLCQVIYFTAFIKTSSKPISREKFDCNFQSILALKTVTLYFLQNEASKLPFPPVSCSTGWVPAENMF
jgi:hypothetical protein